MYLPGARRPRWPDTNDACSHAAAAAAAARHTLLIDFNKTKQTPSTLRQKESF